MQTHLPTKTCTQTFVTALFVTPKHGGQVGRATQQHALRNKEQTTDTHGSTTKPQKAQAEGNEPCTGEYIAHEAAWKLFWNKENVPVVKGRRPGLSETGAWEELTHRCTGELSKEMNVFDIVWGVGYIHASFYQDSPNCILKMRTLCCMQIIPQ